MDSIISFIIFLLVWGFTVSKLNSMHPQGFFQKVIWFSLWLMTLSFFFGNSSTNTTSNTVTGGYGGCDDACEYDEDEYSFWDNDDYFDNDDCWDDGNGYNDWDD